MRIIKYWDRMRDSLTVYYIVREEEDGRKLCCVYDNGGPRFHEVFHGQEMPVYMRIPRDVAETMGLKADGEVEEESATNAHLDDTREVRDRLLTLVEAGLASSDAAAMAHVATESELRRYPQRRFTS
jgi:antitoxin component of MazEF toxin-antitoxin module